MLKKLFLLSLTTILCMGLTIGFAPNVQARSTTKLVIQVRASPQWWNNWMKDTDHPCAWGSLPGAFVKLELQGSGGTFTRTGTTDSHGNIVLDVWKDQTVTVISASAIYRLVPIRMKRTYPIPNVDIDTEPAHLDIEMVSRDAPETVKLEGRIFYSRLAPYTRFPVSFTIQGVCGSKKVTGEKCSVFNWSKCGYFSVDMWPNQDITIEIPKSGNNVTYYPAYTEEYHISSRSMSVGTINASTLRGAGNK